MFNKYKAIYALIAYFLMIYTPFAWAGEWVKRGLEQENIIVLKMSPSKPAVLYAGTAGNGLFKTSDGGQTWQAVGAGIVEKRITGIALHPVDNNRIYVATGTLKLYISRDGGNTWTVNDTSFATTELALFQITRVAVDALNPDLVYAGGLNDGIHRSTDGGKSFSLLSKQLKSFTADALLAHPQKPNVVYVKTTTGTVWGSTDGSQTWTKYPAPSNKLAAFAVGFDLAYVVVKDNGLYRISRNSGQWQLINQSAEALKITDLSVASPTTVYAISGLDILISNDSGQTWQTFSTAVAPQPLKFLVNQGTMPLYAVTGAGLYQYQDAQPLAIEPLQAHVNIGKTVLLTAKGGKGAYFWQADGGSLKANGNQAQFTLPVAGAFYVWLSDGENIVWSLIDDQLPAGTPLSVYMVPKTLSMELGETHNVVVRTLLADLSQQNVTNKVTFTIANPDIADISALGVVTPKKAGKTVVTASYEGLTSRMVLTVNDTIEWVEVEPALIELQEGGKPQDIKVYLVHKSGARQLFENPTMIVVNPAIAALNGNQISGLKRGTTELALSLKDHGLEVPVVVLPSMPLRISPSTAHTQVGEELDFSVSGGFPPYSAKVDQGTTRQQGSNLFFQHNQAGNAVLTLTDSNGQQTSASITINQALFVAPAQTTTTAGGQVNLQANGGSGQYQWQASQGQISNTTGNSVTFTAPNRDGIYGVTVTDSTSFRQDATIIVGKVMFLSPEQLYLGSNEKASVSILGGEPAYQVTASAGQAVVKDKTLDYTAPAASGFYTIEVTDSTGQQRSVMVSVGLDLLITPQAARVAPETTLVLNAAGGFGGKHWVTSKGPLDTNKGDKVTWTAPKVFGPVQIHVIDDAGAIASAEVEVSNENMVVTPSSPHVFMQSQADFSVIGGGAPYTWVVGAGDYTPSKEGSSISYTAPQVKGHYPVEVTDKAGLKAIAHADVYSSKLMVSPKTLYINQGESAQITVSGGTGDYTLWAEAGHMDHASLSLPEEATQIASSYQTGYSVSDSDRITVMDSAGNIALVSVNIQNSVEAQKIWKTVTTYAGEDNQIDSDEMETGLQDFFANNSLIDKKTLFWLVDAFMQ